MSHLKETQIPLILWRWRDGYYKNDQEAVEAIFEAVENALPSEREIEEAEGLSSGTECSFADQQYWFDKGVNHVIAAVREVLRGK